uniref:Uncharacterized protein n=1 Tax=Strigamia maritima TaxID=126957 RepID=T1J346_STRMM
MAKAFYNKQCIDSLLRSSKSAPILSFNSDRISIKTVCSSQSLIDIISIKSDNLLHIKSFPDFYVEVDETQERTNGKEIKVLNEQFLTSLNYKLDRKEVLYFDIRRKQLSRVDKRLMDHCQNIIGINAGENLFRLEYFRHAYELKELLLPLNNISAININAGDFGMLEFLDLSCNDVTTSSIYSLGYLNSLKILNLTNNNIDKFPNALNKTSFPKLETLILDCNYMSHPNNIKVLSRLTNLRYLSLEENGIWCLPFIESKGSSDSVRLKMEALGVKQLILNDGILKIQPKSFNKKTILQMLQKSDRFSKSKVINFKLIGIYLRDENNLQLPFPKLRQLNLKRNKIEEVSCLNAVLTWKKLKELVILDNKLVSLRSIHLKSFDKLLVQCLDIRYSQFSCRIYDPFRDPFHRKRLIKRHFPNYFRDRTFCKCHRVQRTKAQDKLHNALKVNTTTRMYYATTEAKTEPQISKYYSHVDNRQPKDRYKLKNIVMYNRIMKLYVTCQCQKLIKNKDISHRR